MDDIPHEASALIVTLYRGAKAPEPIDASDLTWAELCDTLEIEAQTLPTAPPTADAAAQKRSMLAWSPCELSTPYRLEENVATVTLMTIDVDNDPPAALAADYVAVTPEQIAARLADAGVAGFIYESPSSTPECPRFRVVSPIAELVPPDICRETRLAFAEALGLAPGCGAEGAVEASKLFFVGRLHGTAERRTWRVEGEPLDVGSLEPAALAWGKCKAPAVAAAALADLPPADEGLAAALGDWQAHAGRKHDMCGALGGIMRRLGYGRGKCEAVIRAWLPPDDPSVDVDAGVAWALVAWSKPAELVSGVDSMAALVGEEHARIVHDAAYAGTWAGRLVASARAEAEPWHPAVDDAASNGLGQHWKLGAPRPPLEYWCEGLRLMPSRGKISLVAGLPGAGKGPIADHLAICFALGLPAFGKFPCRKSRVLLLDAEGILLTLDRVECMARAMGIDPCALEGPLSAFDVSSVDLLSDDFYRSISAFDADVIIADSYTSAMLATGLDPNKIEFANLAKLFGSLGRLVIAVAHANKAPLPGERPTLQQVAGSFALAAMAQTGISVWQPNAEDENLVSLACMRGPKGRFPAFDVRFQDVPGDGLAVRYVEPGDEARSAAELKDEHDAFVANKILSCLSLQPATPESWTRIRESLSSADRSGMGAIMMALEQAHVIVRHPGPRGQHGTFQLRDQNDAGPVAVKAGAIIAAAPKPAGSVGKFLHRSKHA